MADRVLLLLGLCAVFGGLLALLTAGSRTGERKGVTRSLAIMETLKRPSPTLREKDLERPFAERVLGPLRLRLEVLGRRITPDERYQRIRDQLDLAGNPPGWTADRVLGLKVTCAILGGAVALGPVPLLGGGLLPTIGVTLLLVPLGWFAPTLWVYQVAHDRSERIRRDLPDALDLLTISVEAGLAFDAALTQVARETRGPLALEFARVLQEMQIGTRRADALRALGHRRDVEELRSFVGAMVQADAFGVSISDVLRVQSTEMRVKRSQRAEELAQKVPVKVLFPLIFCIMPALFIVIMGPAAINIMTAFGKR